MIFFWLSQGNEWRPLVNGPLCTFNFACQALFCTKLPPTLSTDGSGLSFHRFFVSVILVSSLHSFQCASVAMVSFILDFIGNCSSRTIPGLNHKACNWKCDNIAHHFSVQMLCDTILWPNGVTLNHGNKGGGLCLKGTFCSWFSLHSVTFSMFDCPHAAALGTSLTYWKQHRYQDSPVYRAILLYHVCVHVCTVLYCRAIFLGV